MDDREQLRHRFNRNFAHWGIELPLESMPHGVVCLIVQRGWTIWIRLDIDEEDGREHLDYYAMHRMTNDRHLRIYTDGTVESLPAINAMYTLPPEDATEAEIKEAEDAFYAHNQKVQELLDEKGFVMTDQAHASAQLNRYLLTDPDTMRNPRTPDDNADREV